MLCQVLEMCLTLVTLLWRLPVTLAGVGELMRDCEALASLLPILWERGGDKGQPESLSLAYSLLWSGEPPQPSPALSTVLEALPPQATHHTAALLAREPKVPPFHLQPGQESNYS